MITYDKQHCGFITGRSYCSIISNYNRIAYMISFSSSGHKSSNKSSTQSFTQVNICLLTIDFLENRRTLLSIYFINFSIILLISLSMCLETRSLNCLYCPTNESSIYENLSLSMPWNLSISHASLSFKLGSSTWFISFCIISEIKFSSYFDHSKWFSEVFIACSFKILSIYHLELRIWRSLLILLSWRLSWNITLKL